MIDWTLKIRAIKDLKPHGKNPRKLSAEQEAQLKASIDKFGLIDKPIVNLDGGVIGGHQRLKVLKKMGIKEVECYMPGVQLDDKEVEELLVRLNKNTGDWDFDILKSDWDPVELMEWGFSAEEIGMGAELIDTPEDEDLEQLEPPKDPITQTGDLYVLGVHRLLCGDSTNPDDVKKVLDGAEPILMVTDPPYGVNYDATWRSGRLSIDGKKENKRFGKVQNDSVHDWSTSYALFPGNIAYVWHSALFTHIIAKNLIDCGFNIVSYLVWNKHAFALSRGDYHWKHEPCWYVVKKNQKHNWQGSRKETTVWDIDSLQETGRKDKSEDRTEHSTQKPLECMARPIRNNTEKGQGVYDPFLGSGTTLIACEQLGRICYGLEIDPAYCDVIVARWEKLTGKKAVRSGQADSQD